MIKSTRELVYNFFFTTPYYYCRGTCRERIALNFFYAYYIISTLCVFEWKKGRSALRNGYWPNWIPPETCVSVQNFSVIRNGCGKSENVRYLGRLCELVSHARNLLVCLTILWSKLVWKYIFFYRIWRKVSRSLYFSIKKTQVIELYKNYANL